MAFGPEQNRMRWKYWFVRARGDPVRPAAKRGAGSCGSQVRSILHKLTATGTLEPLIKSAVWCGLLRPAVTPEDGMFDSQVSFRLGFIYLFIFLSFLSKDKKLHDDAMFEARKGTVLDGAWWQCQCVTGLLCFVSSRLGIF